MMQPFDGNCVAPAEVKISAWDFVNHVITLFLLAGYRFKKYTSLYFMTSIFKSRVVHGALCIIAGIILIYFFLWRKLELLHAGVGQVSYSAKLVAFGPFFIVFGLYIMIVRPASLKPAEMQSRQQILFWVFFALAGLAGILSFLWFKNQLGLMGYEG